jgi:hypothetical protein
VAADSRVVSVRGVTLTYLRRNRIQAEIGESYGMSQSTISRAVTALTPLLGTALAQHMPVAEDLYQPRPFTAVTLAWVCEPVSPVSEDVEVSC